MTGWIGSWPARKRRAFPRRLTSIGSNGGSPIILAFATPERTYFFGSNDARDAIDKDRIDFRLREAGKFGLTAERRIVPVLSPQAMPEIDDRDYLIAFGSFRIASQTLTIDACGPNI